MPGLIQLPVDHLIDHSGGQGTKAATATLADRMKDSLTVASKMATKAGELTLTAGKAASQASVAAYIKAGEVAGQVGTKVKNYSAKSGSPTAQEGSPTIAAITASTPSEPEPVMVGP